jgi:hypothetical protein
MKPASISFASIVEKKKKMIEKKRKVIDRIPLSELLYSLKYD